MEPLQLTIAGYRLDWWWTAVIVPSALGLRWYLAYRQTTTRTLINGQAQAISQLTELNLLLSQQLTDARARAKADADRAAETIDHMQRCLDQIAAPEKEKADG